jgi:hypothetical protein
MVYQKKRYGRLSFLHIGHAAVALEVVLDTVAGLALLVRDGDGVQLV